MSAVLQPCLIERELASGELVLPFDLNVSTSRGYFFCTRTAADGKNAIEVFRRWIGDMVRADAVNADAANAAKKSAR